MALNRSTQKKLDKNSKAVPTKNGWVDPNTGELLVSIRGLPGAYDWDRKANTFSRNGVKAEFGGNAASKSETTIAPKSTPAPVEPNKEQPEETTPERQTVSNSPQEVTTIEPPAEAAKPAKKSASRKKKTDKPKAE